VQFSVAKVTIFYFGAKGISAFCEPAGCIVLPAAALAKCVGGGKGGFVVLGV
jgi:hypothetical protein